MYKRLITNIRGAAFPKSTVMSIIKQESDIIEEYIAKVELFRNNTGSKRYLRSA